jgi:hypothetical protein
MIARATLRRSLNFGVRGCLFLVAMSVTLRAQMSLQGNPALRKGITLAGWGHRDAPQRTCPRLKKHLKVGGDATLSIGVDLRVRKLGCGVQPPLARV